MMEVAFTSSVFYPFPTTAYRQKCSLIHICHFYIPDIKDVRKLRVCIRREKSSRFRRIEIAPNDLAEGAFPWRPLRLPKQKLFRRCYRTPPQSFRNWIRTDVLAIISAPA